MKKSDKRYVRERRWEPLTQKMETQRFNYRVWQADKYAQLYPRLDEIQKTWKIQCKTCTRIVTDIAQSHGSHWIPKWRHGNYRCRREEWNIYACCVQCNAYDSEMHHNRLTAYVANKYWSERMYVQFQENTEKHRKPRREWVKKKAIYWKNRCEEI